MFLLTKQHVTCSRNFRVSRITTVHMIWYRFLSLEHRTVYLGFFAYLRAAACMHLDSNYSPPCGLFHMRFARQKTPSLFHVKCSLGNALTEIHFAHCRADYEIVATYCRFLINLASHIAKLEIFVLHVF